MINLPSEHGNLQRCRWNVSNLLFDELAAPLKEHAILSAQISLILPCLAVLLSPPRSVLGGCNGSMQSDDQCKAMIDTSNDENEISAKSVEYVHK